MHANQTPVTTSRTSTAHTPALTLPNCPGGPPAPVRHTVPGGQSDATAGTAATATVDEPEEAGYGYGV